MDGTTVKNSEKKKNLYKIVYLRHFYPTVELNKKELNNVIMFVHIVPYSVQFLYPLAVIIIIIIIIGKKCRGINLYDLPCI